MQGSVERNNYGEVENEREDYQVGSEIRRVKECEPCELRKQMPRFAAQALSNARE